MCTSIAMRTTDFYFGRNLDLEYDFGQRVVILFFHSARQTIRPLDTLS
jgi:hypothetical protein